MERTAFMSVKDIYDISNTKKDYIFLRIISLVLAIFDILISILIKVSNPDAPFYILWPVVFFVAFGFIFISTLTSKFVRENASSILYITYFLSTTGLVYNCYSYNFLTEQSWLILFAVSAVTLVVKKLTHLVLYLVTISLSSISLLYWMENPGVSRHTFSITLIMFCLIVYISMKAKLTAQLALEKSENHVKRMAYHDSLTGLPNRYYLDSCLIEAMVKADNANQKLAVMFIDLDDFKTINDKYGHILGDMLLQQAGTKLLSCIKVGDTIFRYGGDEFIALLSNVGKDECTSLARKIIDEFSHPFEISGNKIYSSLSIGISIYPDHGQDSETMIKLSDKAMYHAKQQGKNNFQFFNNDLSDNMPRT
jgi:diguanylate cyclase (GGDEF)-like protein